MRSAPHCIILKRTAVNVILTIFFLLQFVCAGLYSQEDPHHIADSLRFLLKQEKDPVRKARLTNAIGESYSYSDPDSSFIYCGRAYSLLRKIISVSGSPVKDSAERFLASPSSNLGYAFAMHGKHDSALFYFRICLEIDRKYGSPEEIASSYNNLGNICEKQSNIQKAMEYYNLALGEAEKSGNKDALGLEYNNIGHLYRRTGETEEANKFFKKAFDLFSQTGNKQFLCNLLNTMATIQEGKKNYRAALDLFVKSLEIINDMNYVEGRPFVLNNIGRMYCSMGKYAEAIPYLQQGLELRKSLGESPEVPISLLNIAIAKMEIGKMEEAIRYAREAEKDLHRYNMLDIYATYYRFMYNWNKQKNNYAAAIGFLEKYVVFRDSLQNETQKKELIKKQLNYEYNKKTAADSVKNAELQKVKDAQLRAQTASLKQEKTQRYALYGGLVLVAGFLIFVFNRFRVTQRQKKTIEDQKVLVDAAYGKLHEKNKEVMDSIHYAKRIQKALLTPERYMERVLASFREDKK
ncbi:MAG: tetratricopeptide repeat protein [Bacteroidia bacterium]